MNTIFYKTLHKKLLCFIALFLVAVLGSGMFLSLMSLPDAVETSLNNYLNESNLMDVKITSSIGFSSADAAAVGQIKSVDSVMPVSTVNALLSINDNYVKTEDGQKATAKVSSLDVELAESNDKGNINRLKLQSGRFPESEEECVIDTDARALKGIKIGSKITLTGDGEDIFASLSVNEFTVVGTVDVPTYITKNLGTENVGSGQLNSLIYVPDTVFTTDNFTELYVRLTGLGKYNYSGNKYFEKIQSFSQEVLSLGADRLEARAQLVAAIAEEQIAKDKAELEAFTKSFNSELEASQKKLDEINGLATDGDSQIKDKETAVENSLTETQKKLLEKKENFVKISDAYIADLAQYNIDRETFSADREVFVSNFSAANSRLPEQEQKLNKVKAEMLSYEKKIALNQQVVDGYSDPSKLPDFDELLANTDTNGLDADFIKYMKKCAKDTSHSLGTISLSQQQLEYAAKKIEFNDVSALYNRYKKIVDNYDVDVADLQAREDGLQKRHDELEKRKEKIEKENQDILSGENAISNETFTLKLELAELKIKVSDAKENKETYEKEYKKIETEGNAKIENLTRSLEANEVLMNNTDVATWSVSDVRSIQGYDSLNSTVSAVSAVSKILAILALVLTAFICLLVMLKYARADYADYEKLKLFGITKQAIASSYLTVFIPIYLLGVLSGVAFTTYILPVLVKNILDIQFAIPTIEIPVPIKHMIIAAVVLAVIVPVVFSLIFTGIKFVLPKNKKTSKRSALRKLNLTTTLIATAVSLSLALTSGGLFLGNYLNSRAGLAKDEGIVYDAIADFSFPMEFPSKAIFVDTAVSESLFAQRHNVTGVVNYELFVLEDAKDFEKFISTESKLTDNGVIISELLAESFEKKAGEELEIKLPDGASAKLKIIGVSDNTAQSVMYITEKKFEESFDREITYNCAFLNFGKTKLSVSKIDETLMKNAAVSKVTSTEAIEAELSLNNSISNTILISVSLISVLWSALCMLTLLLADIKRKNHH